MRVAMGNQLLSTEEDRRFVADCLVRRATRSARRGAHDEALVDFAAAASIGHPVATRRLSRWPSQEGGVLSTGALETLRRFGAAAPALLARFPEDPHVLVLAARHELESLDGELARAEAHLDALAALTPDAIAPLYLRLAALTARAEDASDEDQGRLDDAVIALSARLVPLARSPQDTPLDRWLGDFVSTIDRESLRWSWAEALRRRGRPDEARAVEEASSRNA